MEALDQIQCLAVKLYKWVTHGNVWFFCLFFSNLKQSGCVADNVRELENVGSELFLHVTEEQHCIFGGESTDLCHCKTKAMKEDKWDLLGGSLKCNTSPIDRSNNKNYLRTLCVYFDTRESVSHVEEYCNGNYCHGTFQNA